MKTETNTTISWIPFWIAGFLFSSGIGAFPNELVNTNFFMKFIEAFAYVAIWPLFLGKYFAS